MSVQTDKFTEFIGSSTSVRRRKARYFSERVAYMALNGATLTFVGQIQDGKFQLISFNGGGL